MMLEDLIGLIKDFSYHKMPFLPHPLEDWITLQVKDYAITKHRILPI